MNKQFLEPTYFELHYNNDFKEANIVWKQNGQFKGFHVKGFETIGIDMKSVWSDDRPTFRIAGHCTSIRTENGKTVIE